MVWVGLILILACRTVDLSMAEASLGLELSSVYNVCMYDLSLFSTLYQFFQVFPKYQKCPLYITGEVRIIQIILVP